MKKEDENKRKNLSNIIAFILIAIGILIAIIPFLKVIDANLLDIIVPITFGFAGFIYCINKKQELKKRMFVMLLAINSILIILGVLKIFS